MFNFESKSVNNNVPTGWFTKGSKENTELTFCVKMLMTGLIPIISGAVQMFYGATELSTTKYQYDQWKQSLNNK